MKLYNKKPVIAGLLLFVVTVTFPLWKKAIFSAEEFVEPEHYGEEHCCVQSRTYMRKSHMKLLDEWRKDAVRGNRKDYVNPKGIHYKKSLMETCLGCHTKEDFCDTCHKAADVKLYCFDCHITEGDLKEDTEHPNDHGQVFKPAK